MQVRPSHRAVGVQLRDGGAMSAITVRDVVLTARWDAWDWWGGAEAIVISRLRREADQATVGALHDMTLRNVSGVSEAGVVLAGEAEFPLGRISLHGLRLGMAKLTGYRGGLRDLRPGPWDVEDAAPGVLYARHVQQLDVEVRRRDYAMRWCPPGVGARLAMVPAWRWLLKRESGGMTELRMRRRQASRNEVHVKATSVSWVD